MVDFFTKTFNNAKVAGLLLTKYVRAQEIGLHLEFDPACQLNKALPVSINADALVTILGNLIDNAYEAIEEKMLYHLEPAALAKYKPNINITLTHKDRTSLVVIEDNGIGIKEEDKKKIFAPFYTSKPSSKKSGSGIGSYFVKMSIEEYHKGRIWFESRYTKGTKFFIEIPKYNSQIELQL